ncbi:NAD(P)-dependent oxidoreductase [Anatilimnocola floriformis]|uniref:NAD(P)-dependent oxidoreductase n=1 Tax=Anatilimnocola floriformis TaxID=2948575 RepID=UPI0020C59FE2|nr:NAD(P)-dependent oxidoreductase [Anatilimnocola floriformis]
MSQFRVALTADFYEAGQLRYRDIGLDLLRDSPAHELISLAAHRSPIEADQLAGVNGVIVLSPRITAHSLSAAHDLLAIGRFGVGFDSVDVAACTAADVLLYITVGAVDHSVAEATVGWLLAMTHHVRTKDQLVRSGEWDARSRYMGSELRDRTLGIVGFGGIGRAVLQMLGGFRMQPPLVFDPFVSAEAIAAVGGRQVSLEELLAKSDFVSLHCPLNDQTRNLIGARELALLKPTAYLINTARGGIVNEDALFAALQENHLAGAALDCFEQEPLMGPTRWAEFDNVLLAPHSIAWTNELFRDIGRAACQGMLDLAGGIRPRGIVNPEVLERPGFLAKWQRLRQ